MGDKGVSWAEFEREAPEFAASVLARLTAHEHHVVATVRANGQPRVGGTTVNFTDGRLWIGMMAAAARVGDLRRHLSCALHSAPLSTTLPEGEGDVRLDAEAAELSGDEFAALLRSIGFDAADFGDSVGFELFPTRVSIVEVAGDEMVLRKIGRAHV